MLSLHIITKDLPLSSVCTYISAHKLCTCTNTIPTHSSDDPVPDVVQRKNTEWTEWQVKCEVQVVQR